LSLFIEEAVINYQHNHTVKNIPPKLTNPKELITAYPKIKEKTTEADDEIPEKVYQLQEVQEQRKRV